MKHVIIQSMFANSEILWKFTKSETGVLDYKGKIKEDINLSEYQIVHPSLCFARSDYFFMQDILQAKTKVAFSKDYAMPSDDEFTFFSYIPHVLLAMEANDTLLVAELLCRKASVFEKLAPIVNYLVESKIVEIFFSEMFGTFYSSTDNYGSLRFLSENFEKKINFKLKSETLEEAFIRYFKENKSNKEITFSLPIVGTDFGNWNVETRILNRLLNQLNAESFETQIESIKNVKHNFYKSLEVLAQIEPYNKADKNAIVVMIDDVAAKISGYGGKSKAGYIRRTAAEIIRLARHELITFETKILRISSEIVISLTF